MIEIHVQRMSPEVGGLILGRGLGVPPLSWVDRPNGSAGSILSNLSDSQLFAPHLIRDPDMAVLVRGLLYLWAGLTEEALNLLEGIECKEKLYLAALCRRQAGDGPGAKEYFQHMEGHEIFEKMVQAVKSTVSPSSEKLVKRILDMVLMIGEWEPYVFIDVVEAGRAGKLEADGVKTVCQLQHAEFKYLFAECYMNATGVDVTQAVEEEKVDVARVRELRKSREAARRRSMQESQDAAVGGGKSGGGTSEEKVDQALNAAGKGSGGGAGTGGVGGGCGGLKVACPKCGRVASLGPEARGKKHQCDGCGASFLVPGGSGGTSGTSGRADRIHVSCPKCGTAQSFGLSARGKMVSCGKCRASFVVGGEKVEA